MTRITTTTNGREMSRNVCNGADVTRDGRLFQKLAPETGKARFPTVERLNSSTARWLVVEVDRSLCRDGTSATRVKYDDRYAGALPFTAR